MDKDEQERTEGQRVPSGAYLQGSTAGCSLPIKGTDRPFLLFRKQTIDNTI